MDGVDFQEAGIEFADRAKDNETATLNNLVYFKHRWADIRQATVSAFSKI